MDLFNTTRLSAAYTLGMEPSGREWLVVAVKGTFSIPPGADDPVRLAPEQVPIALADVMGGESGMLPIEEGDLALRKRRCDVLVRGSAYAPGGRAASRVHVGARIGDWSKSFVVTGERHWHSGALGTRPGAPAAFTSMPITYERAFGGIDVRKEAVKNAVYLSNPVGCGYFRPGTGTEIDGARMPNTEATDRPVERPDGDYVPMSFGPIGRNWVPRYRFAGTYDQRWLDDDFPFLPADFDDRYYQAAPEDQQIPYPAGGEEVVLLNLSADGRIAFRLPRVEACITVAPRYTDREEMQAVLDTIVIEPEERRFTLTWRCARALRRSLFEIDEVVIGRVGPSFLRERDGLPLRMPVRALQGRASNGQDGGE